MAKAGRELIKLESSEGTGYFYVTSKNRRTMTNKLELKKYDPKLRKHVLFVEKKIKLAVSTVTVTQSHTLGVDAAKKALAQFEGDISKYGMKLVWNGASAEIKGTGASGDVKVTDNKVTVNVKLGLLAKAAGVKPDMLEKSIQKRLTAALSGTQPT